MRRFCLFFILVIMSTGCRKEKDLLKGDITGRIQIRNEDYSLASDRSGVRVSLYSDTVVLDNTTTDIRGIYRFEDIPYGKYRLDLFKEKYVKSRSNYTVYHVGGYSPSIRDGGIYEIPTFNLTIDSVNIFPNSEVQIKLYVKVNGDTLLPYEYYSFAGFCSKFKNVTKDNYTSFISGILIAGWGPSPQVAVYGEVRNRDSNFQSLISDSIYIRLYPLAFGQGYFKDFFKEALGKPSNVIGFKWH